MAILASYNYYGPSTSAIVIGAGLAIAILVALRFSRSAWLGFLGGAISWGVIAYVVFGTGYMLYIMRVGGSIFFGLVGAVAGMNQGLRGAVAVSSRLSRADRRRMQNLCVKCGSDLRGSKDRCPECGTSLEKS